MKSWWSVQLANVAMKTARIEMLDSPAGLPIASIVNWIRFWSLSQLQHMGFTSNANFLLFPTLVLSKKQSVWLLNLCSFKFTDELKLHVNNLVVVNHFKLRLCSLREFTLRVLWIEFQLIVLKDHGFSSTLRSIKFLHARLLSVCCLAWKDIKMGILLIK